MKEEPLWQTILANFFGAIIIIIGSIFSLAAVIIAINIAFKIAKIILFNLGVL